MPRPAAHSPASPVDAAEHVKSPDLSRLPALAAAAPPGVAAEPDDPDGLLAPDADLPATSPSSPGASPPPERSRSAIPAVDTPVMRQYLEIKERYPDCIVFF